VALYCVILHPILLPEVWGFGKKERRKGGKHEVRMKRICERKGGCSYFYAVTGKERDG
jgi:hypothetical protein